MSDEVYIVAGAGHAGASAAAAIRAAGFAGRVILVGDEDHLPYERPPLSKDVLLHAENPLPLIFPESFYEEQKIELRLGRQIVAVQPDKQEIVLEGGETLHFDKLLLACGARARAYPILDSLGARAHVLRNIKDAIKLRPSLQSGQSIVIVGGGVIGLEVAASAASKGVKVTVLERAARLMPRAPQPLGKALYQRHVQHGVTFELGVELASASVASNGMLHLEAKDGRIFDADFLIYGVGVELNSELATQAGLAVDDGVLIDDYGRTSHPAIYAAGDIARQKHPFFGAVVRQENWANAVHQGTAVGRAMVTGEACPHEPPWYWTDQYGSNFQVAGRPEADEWIPRGGVAGGKYILFGLTGGIVTGAIAVDSGRDMRPARALIAQAARIDAKQLADPKTDLRRLAQSAK